MLRFRGLHIVAGIAAMGVSAVLGMIVHLNNTAIFTSSCVAYVAVSMWAEGKISKRRSQLQGRPQIPNPAASDHVVDQPAAEQPAAEQIGEQRQPDHHAGQRRTRREGNAA
ncbi:hypothetical protein [Arthrobacter sp. ISL-28]|uniref:hypothetical protein n=1 Tax=Arthrobacter sp. ISL-28 TaxID=2819108 RepID=UPI001BEA9DDA|nr:hypothetical protein [Arthrobacter sp. ISL-28]MBT2522222.1 hypothetical protein [Arthrobacter sp. ISL-28]